MTDLSLGRALPLMSHIAGRSWPSSSGRAREVLYPATNARLGEVELAGAAELDEAVRAAEEAQARWARVPGVERARVLSRAASLLREHRAELARLEVLDTGKPISEAEAVDIHSGADAVEYFAHAAALLQGSYQALGSNHALVIPEPLGVVAGIGAWNYPFQIACWKSAPALAAGNAMIFKPSELTPVTALRLAELYLEAGLPPGLFQVVQGDGEVGQLLAEHAGVHKISLTGSVATGRRVMASAATTLKQVTLELGGKSPLLVFDDADVPNAVQAAMLGNFYTQGEVCSNGTRVFVQRALLDAFLAELKAKTERLRMGDPMHPDTQVGALISRAHKERVVAHVEAARSAGAVPLPLDVPPPTAAERALFEAGNFFFPVVFTSCSDDMAIAREEIFGPVMSVLVFDTEEEAIARANDTPFGLAAGVMTRDLARAHRVSLALEAGVVWVNTYNVTPVEVPFGGRKQSGFGRENSLEGLRAYTQTKTVYYELGDVDSPYR